MLALGALAAAAGMGAPADARLALTTTLAAREPDENAVVGRFANEAVLVLPPRDGTIGQYLSEVRRDVFAALGEQRVPYEELAASLDPTGAGDRLSVSLLFLPATLSGGVPRARRLGSVDARRTAAGICPTGADLDLFVVESPPPLADGARPLLRVGVMTARPDISAALAGRWLDGWAAAIAELSNSEWTTEDVRFWEARVGRRAG
jgi:hypothetical protein